MLPHGTDGCDASLAQKGSDIGLQNARQTKKDTLKLSTWNWEIYTLPETNSLHLKMDAWNMLEY